MIAKGLLGFLRVFCPLQFVQVIFSTISLHMYMHVMHAFTRLEMNEKSSTTSSYVHLLVWKHVCVCGCENVCSSEVHALYSMPEE